MELQQILNRVRKSQQTPAEGIKTAAAQPTAPVSSTDALRGALRETLAGAGQEKTAAVAPAAEAPTDSLLKMAADLTAAEEEVLTKQASLYGAAMCDGFMNRFGQYEQAAAQLPAATTKTAAVAETFEKFAAENPELTQEAYNLGYQTKLAELQKTAAEEYTQGYNDTMGEVYKLAADVYATGAYAINNVLRTLQ